MESISYLITQISRYVEMDVKNESYVHYDVIGVDAF